MQAKPGQPICIHYTGATLADLHGDYACKCRAGIPYERWARCVERWPCRRRHILGVEQHPCSSANYGTKLTEDVDTQVTAMIASA